MGGAGEGKTESASSFRVYAGTYHLGSRTEDKILFDPGADDQWVSQHASPPLLALSVAPVVTR